MLEVGTEDRIPKLGGYAEPHVGLLQTDNASVYSGRRTMESTHLVVMVHVVRLHRLDVLGQLGVVQCVVTDVVGDIHGERAADEPACDVGHKQATRRQLALFVVRTPVPSKHSQSIQQSLKAVRLDPTVSLRVSATSGHHHPLAVPPLSPSHYCSFARERLILRKTSTSHLLALK